MAFVPVPNVALITLNGDTDGQSTVNDLTFVSTAPPITALSLATLTQAIENWYVDNIAPNLSETWIFSHARGRDLTTQASFVFISATGAGITGGTAGEQSPSNVAANVVFETGLAGRNNHGSNRVPAIPNSLIETNTLDSGWLTAILVAYNLLIAPSTTLPGGWTWVVTSRFSGSSIVGGKVVPTPRAEGIFHEIFSTFFADQFVDSQKTRLPKHGQ
jgi:hypothetical protein